MIDLYVDDPFESLYREIKAMIKYCYSRGIQVPADIVRRYGEIEREIVENIGKSADGTTLQFSGYTKIVPLGIKMGTVHNCLSEILEPAVPKSIYMIEEQLDRDSIWTQFGCLPIVRRFMLLSIVSIISFIAVCLSSGINNAAISKSIFDNQGTGLLLVFIFLMSAASLGTAFSTLLKLSRYIEERTFDPSYETSYYVKFLVGLMSGLIITQLVPPEVFGNMNVAGKPVLALLGGFSVDLVYKVLQHLVDVVESALVPGKKSLSTRQHPMYMMYPGRGTALSGYDSGTLKDTAENDRTQGASSDENTAVGQLTDGDTERESGQAGKAAS